MYDHKRRSLRNPIKLVFCPFDCCPRPPSTMTDLTVLVSPMPLYPAIKPGFIFGRRSPRPVSRPVMVTLESEIEPEDEADSEDKPHSSHTRRRSRADSTLLSPPPNTWTSRRPRHRPTRSRSAPPERTVYSDFRENVEQNCDVLTHPGIDIVRLPNTAPLSQPSSFSSPPSFVPSTRGGELVRPPPPLRESYLSLLPLLQC
jgi:hypothetical protein